MLRWSYASLMVVAVLEAGCSCNPELPDPPPVDTSDDEEHTGDTSLGDTAPPPPCPFPEIEPNGTVTDAQDVPTEVRFCGEFESDGDADVWHFELPEPGWLRVQTTAQSIGSFADLALVVTSDDGRSFAQRLDNLEDRDVTLTIPVDSGGFQAIVREQNGRSSDEDHFYEGRASIIKAPVETNAVEIEPNNDAATATVLQAGDFVLATLGDPDDDDWYAIDLPAGRSTLTATIHAYEAGSPANTSLRLRNSNEQPPDACAAINCFWSYGQAGWEPDPSFTFNSSTNQRMYIRVVEEAQVGGSAYWYALAVDVEVSP